MVCGKLINTPERNRRKAFLFALDLIRNKRFDYKRGRPCQGRTECYERGAAVGAGAAIYWME